jgi:hypothetical protein
MLATSIANLKGNAELEEAVILALELIRLGMLNAEATMFPTYNGAPMRGDGESCCYAACVPFTDSCVVKDQKFNLLISRVAGLGTLHHKPIGFTGPLSQHLLGYNSVINAVRSTVRDLIEVSATQMFMGGFVKRDVENLSDIAMR